MLQLAALTNFSCLGDRCEDTCCQGWSMQVDEATRTRYAQAAPELLPDVVQAEEGGWIMRKDPTTSLCVRFEGGLCGVHKQYGDSMLGDACHFYPRTSRSLGTQIMRSATLSCPEIARLTLFTDPAPLIEAEDGRQPNSLTNYLPTGMTAEQATAVHRAFLDATADTEATAEQIFMRVYRATRSLELLAKESWHVLTSFYITDADLRIPDARPDVNDCFNLLHMLCGIVVATRKKPSPRLMQTIGDIETALAAKLDWQNVTIATSDQSIAGLERILTVRFENTHIYTPILRRWLYSQLSMGMHPFSGFGGSMQNVVTLMGVRMAIVKLALLSFHAVHGAPTDQDIVRIVQSLARVIDHLGDPEFSLMICAETGWSDEARLRGLLAL